MADSDLQVAIRVDASGARDGADQAKAAVAGIGPQIEALSKTFDELGKSLKGGLEGISQIGKAIAGLSGGKLNDVSASLKTMGEAVAGVGRSAPAGLKSVSAAASELSASLGSAAGQGASKLALLGEAAGGVAGVALAVGQVALTAATATAEWAENTEHSATASAQAKENAANLNEAISGAGDAFSKVGDTLANAFAPVLTTVVNALTGLAQGFEDSYNKGGVAKTIVDALILAFELLASGIEIAIGAIVAVLEQVRSQIQQWRDEFGIVATSVGGDIGRVEAEFQTLGRIFGDVLSGDFSKAVSDFKSGLADMERQARQTVADIQQQVAKLRADQLAGGHAMAGAAGAAVHDVAEPFGGGPSRRSGGRSPKGHSGGGGPSARSQAPTAVAGGACDCDPAAAAACEQTAQDGKTEAAHQGDQQRLQSSQETAEKLKAGQQSDDQEMVDETVEATNKEVEAHNKAAAKIAEAQKKAAEESKRAWDKSVGAIIQSFGQGLLKMAEGGETFGQLMRSIGQKILTDWVNNISKMVSNWARGIAAQVLSTQAGETAKDSAKRAGAAQGAAIDAAAGLKSLIGDAAQAAGAAYRGVLQTIPAPFGIPVAAGAAAMAFAAVMAFRGMIASAAGGFDIPAGLNPLTQLHAQEMVLPARLANPMRDMLANFGSGSATTPGGGHTFSFGDTHIHGAPNMSPADFRQALADHRANVAGAVADALRSGWRPSYRQPVGAL